MLSNNTENTSACLLVSLSVYRSVFMISPVRAFQPSLAISVGRAGDTTSRTPGIAVHRAVAGVLSILDIPEAALAALSALLLMYHLRIDSGR